MVLACIMGVLRHDFLSPLNLRDILINSSIYVVMAAGMTALIINAQIDISVGQILAVAAVVAATGATRGWPLPAMLVGAVLAGMGLGGLNGLLVAGLKIPSIVATLATWGGLAGAVILATHGNEIAVPTWVSAFGARTLLGLPTIVWIAALTAVGTHLYLAQTRPGRQHYAVGSNPRSAQLSGLNADGITFRSFVLMGALAGVAAFQYVLWYPLVSPSKVAPQIELEVITAVVVGGTDIFGGRGTMLGTVLAVVLLKLIGVALTFLGTFVPAIRSEVQPAVQGLLILVAVLANSLGRRD